MNQALPLATSSTQTDQRTRFAVSTASTRLPWRMRMRRLFVIDFAELDTLDLSLGSPAEFDSYVSDLFERGGHAHP